MDSTSFDQFFLTEDTIGIKAKFLKEGTEVETLLYKGVPVSIQMPVKLALTVTQTGGGVRGDTAQGNVMKEATLETGHVVKVPLFIKQGDAVVVNTETGEYVERA